MKVDLSGLPGKVLLGVACGACGFLLATALTDSRPQDTAQTNPTATRPTPAKTPRSAPPAPLRHVRENVTAVDNAHVSTATAARESSPTPSGDAVRWSRLNPSAPAAAPVNATAASRPTARPDDSIPRMAQGAARRVEAMVADYDLSPRQRTGIFYTYFHAAAAQEGVIAAGSSSDTPAGTSDDAATGTTVDEDIHEQLTEEQQLQYEEEWVDRDLWWTEIVDQLESDIDGETVVVAVDEPDDSEAPSDDGDSGEDAAADDDRADAEDDSSHGGGNLFDMIGGG